MGFLKTSLAQLAPLEWIEPAAFKPDEDYSKSLCGFMLVLALVHSDVKNLALFHHMLEESRPVDGPGVRADWGEYSGLVNHVNRVHISLMHELLDFIQNNKQVLDDDRFKKVLRQMKTGPRSQWQSLVAAALGNARSTNKDLMLIRNKVGFHYDPKQLLAGLDYFYLKRGITEHAYLSRGRNWQQSRFYFADAAAEGVMYSRSEPADIHVVYGRVRAFSDQLNHAIWNMVTTFVQERGFPYHADRRDD